MAQMAEIGNMQAALAQRVQASMNRINAMLEEDGERPHGEESDATPLDSGDCGDPETWRRKIALLSTPIDANKDGMQSREDNIGAVAAVTEQDSSQQPEIAPFLLVPSHSSANRPGNEPEPDAPVEAGKSSLTLREADRFEVGSSVTIEEDPDVAVWRKRIQELSGPAIPQDDANSLQKLEPLEAHANQDTEGSIHKSAGTSWLLCCWCWSSKHHYSRVVLRPAPEDIPDELPAEMDDVEHVTRL